MNPPTDQNEFSTSERTNDSKDCHANPRPDNNNHKALTVVQDLSWGSLFPLFAVYFKQGPFLIYYQRVTCGGLKLVSLLHLLGVTTSDPLKIEDLYYFGTPDTNFWEIKHQVTRACKDQLGQIVNLIEKYFPQWTPL